MTFHALRQVGHVLQVSRVEVDYLRFFVHPVKFPLFYSVVTLFNVESVLLRQH